MEKRDQQKYVCHSVNRYSISGADMRYSAFEFTLQQYKVANSVLTINIPVAEILRIRDRTI